MKNFEIKNKNYKKPHLKIIGKIGDITLKTGSISDFGGNKYTF